jgi:hypothetical protein
MFKNSIDCKLLRMVEWDLKKMFKSYLKNQWIWCWEQIWLHIVEIFHVIISKSEYCWWKNNNYTEKLVIERLSQTTYDFPNH